MLVSHLIYLRSIKSLESFKILGNGYITRKRYFGSIYQTKFVENLENATRLSSVITKEHSTRGMTYCYVRLFRCFAVFFSVARECLVMSL